MEEAASDDTVVVRKWNSLIPDGLAVVVRFVGDVDGPDIIRCARFAQPNLRFDFVQFLCLLCLFMNMMKRFDGP